MPMVYQLIAKMLAYRIQKVLHAGIHTPLYRFVPRRQIHDNISNVLTATEYAKYSQQDVGKQLVTKVLKAWHS